LKKPSPTVNKEAEERKTLHCAAGTNIKNQMQKSNKPADNVLLYQISVNMSFFNDTKKIIDPTKYAT
jgi:hypothetical protein